METYEGFEDKLDTPKAIKWELLYFSTAIFMATFEK